MCVGVARKLGYSRPRAGRARLLRARGVVSPLPRTTLLSRTKASQLAGRVRSLLGPLEGADLVAAATELGVTAGDLREIVVHQTPYPSTAVLASIVAAKGVDAGWLLTGEYSPATHRAAEEDGSSPASRVTRLLRDAEETTGAW